MAQVALATSNATYKQRRPEELALYKLVAEYLETFLAEAREQHDRGLPKYVENEFRAYLKCGIHAHGFLRARCRECQRELLLAFSCKKRGVCASCNARRMCGTAAYLGDHVFPEVPVRQWVLSIPFELRLLLARNPEALSSVGRLFVREIMCFQREQARIQGITKPRCGAMCFPQRFGGSLNLNVHYHVAVADGVFTLESGAERAEFHRLSRPTQSDLEAVAFNVDMRVRAWLRRKQLLDEDAGHFSNEPPERTAMEACLEGSLGLGDLVRYACWRRRFRERSRRTRALAQILRSSATQPAALEHPAQRPSHVRHSQPLGNADPSRDAAIAVSGTPCRVDPATSASARKVPRSVRTAFILAE